MTDLSGDPTFKEALKRVRSKVFSVTAHQEITIELIVEELQPKRDPSYNRIFQVGFTFQEPPMEIELEGYSVKSQRLHNESAKFDLLAWLWESAEGVKGLLEYNTDIFSYATTTEIRKQFLNIYLTTWWHNILLKLMNCR